MKIVWDRENKQFLDTKRNGLQVSLWTWILRDVFSAVLYIVFADLSTQSYVQQEAPAGWSVKFELKPYTAEGLEGEPLVSAGTWALNGSGSSAYYTAEIDLNQAALISDMGTAASKTYKAEFTLQDAGGRNQDSTQIDVTVIADVNRPE